ncbi:MAG: type IV pilus assembly protein PilM [Candidatus Sungbacteria bacterium]|nr:type IV pilus assembly protein PilM [Candidatus Sungbacteria bacterium]
MVDIPFFKKITFPKFSLGFIFGKPTSVIGIDIGTHSAKVVQLKYESERAILETYGELLTEGYLKSAGGGGGFLRYLDSDISSLLKDLLRESNVTTKEAVLSVPAEASFITLISFPRISKREIDAAVPYEARKYVPIPAAEVVLDWDIFESEAETDTIDVLLVAVPREIVEKYKRVAELAGIHARALEVETFSIVRSLMGTDPTPTAIINLGQTSTTLSLVDRGRVRISHNFSRGSQELTRALERGMNITRERAEEIKRTTGLSERIEEREITSIMAPLVETLFAEIERMIALYNRKAPRKIQKINLTGGGSNLKGIVDYVSGKFGVEVSRGNPFARMVTPAFMQPTLREIGPSFSVAAGLALREITTR